MTESFDSSSLHIRKPRLHLPLSDGSRGLAGVTPPPGSRVFVGFSSHAGTLRGNTPPSPLFVAKCGALGGRCGSAGVLKKARVRTGLRRRCLAPSLPPGGPFRPVPPPLDLVDLVEVLQRGWVVPGSGPRRRTGRNVCRRRRPRYVPARRA